MCAHAQGPQRLPEVGGLQPWRKVSPFRQRWSHHQGVECKHRGVFANPERSHRLHLGSGLQSRWQAHCLWQLGWKHQNLGRSYWEVFENLHGPHRCDWFCCIQPRWQAPCFWQWRLLHSDVGPRCRSWHRSKFGQVGQGVSPEEDRAEICWNFGLRFTISVLVCVATSACCMGCLGVWPICITKKVENSVAPLRQDDPLNIDIDS